MGRSHPVARFLAALKRRRRWLVALLVIGTAAPLAADQYVRVVGGTHVHKTLAEVPERRVALVLGTGKWAPSGRENLFYRRRLEAAAELYHAGKVERLLLSGDNSRVGYDEPSDMMTDLVKLGVPASHMVRDYAGFRTLDSVVRAGEVFGLNGFTVVSQAFHCQRAVFVARAHGLDAVGYCARDVGGAVGWKVRLREVLARAQAVVDVKLRHRAPKFLGDPVAVP